MYLLITRKCMARREKPHLPRRHGGNVPRNFVTANLKENQIAYTKRIRILSLLFLSQVFRENRIQPKHLFIRMDLLTEHIKWIKINDDCERRGWREGIKRKKKKKRRNTFTNSSIIERAISKGGNRP